MHLLFLLGVWICYVCTEYASAGFVKGCGYPCQAVLAFGVQSVYIFLFRRLDCNCFFFFFFHCQSTWFTLADIPPGVD